MHVNHRWKAVPFAALLAAAISPLSAVADDKPQSVEEFLGPNHAALPQTQDLAPSRPVPHGPSAVDRFRFWNQIAIDASGLDHTPVAPGETRVFGEQLGPGRSSRAMAIVHIAIFDAVNAIAGGYESYTGIPPRPRSALRVDAAIAQAAHDTLVGVFPSQAPLFDALLAEDLARIQRESPRSERGIGLGSRRPPPRSSPCARATAPTTPSRGWAPTTSRAPAPGSLAAGSDQPVSRSRSARTGARCSRSCIALGHAVPRAAAAGDDQRRPTPPRIDEVKRLGGDGDRDAHRAHRRADARSASTGPTTARRACAPRRGSTTRSRRTIAEPDGHGRRASSRGCSRWSTWPWPTPASPSGNRSTTTTSGGRSPASASPTRAPARAVSGDGNPATIGDPTFSPLGAPASNLQGPNFTPPFPAYPSGHAGFGGALFQTLRRFYGTRRHRLHVRLGRVQRRDAGQRRRGAAARAAQLPSLSQAEEENGQSRIYLGIHWSFDKTAGHRAGPRRWPTTSSATRSCRNADLGLYRRRSGTGRCSAGGVRAGPSCGPVNRRCYPRMLPFR